MFHYVHCSLIYNSQKLERTQMPFNRGMDTENVVHVHHGILLSYQKQCLCVMSVYMYMCMRLCVHVESRRKSQQPSNLKITKPIYPEDVPTGKKDACSTMFITALFIIARSWKEPRCPSTEEWIQKMWYIHTREWLLKS